MKNKVIGLIGLIFCLTMNYSFAQVIFDQITLTVIDEDDLRASIIISNDNPDIEYVLQINVPNGLLLISQPLPKVSGVIRIEPKFGKGKVTIRSTAEYNGRFLIVASNAFLQLGSSTSDDLTISSFSSMEDGGGVLVESGGELLADDTIFKDVHSNGSGGVGSCLGKCTFNHVTILGASADGFACGVNAPFGSWVMINNGLIIDDDNNCHTNFFDVNGGELSINNSYIATDSDSPFASCTGSCNLTNNIFEFGPGSGPPKILNTKHDRTQNKTVCNDFGTGAFNSRGFNIDAGPGCFLNHARDLENTDPMVTIDTDGIPQPNAGSPLIESGPVDFVNNILPCSYKDLNGLGRPQDFDKDGVFTCDRGPVEVQSGPDLTNAQSALYYDVDRSGEGVVVEMLSADSALVTMFTYHPNKTELMWFISVGQVVGNTLVFDQVLRTSGGVFGSSFDANAIVSTDVGGMSIVFPDCDSLENEGRLIFDADFAFENELENLLVKNRRLSRLLNCDQSQPNALSGRSGSFYDSDRSGEGVFVQVLDNGSAVILFYTYTPDGKQTWLISSDVEITGNTITANMIYPATGTGFGSQFNGSELDFQNWGTLIFEYMPGCNQMNMSFNSTVAGYGSGNYIYNRLTLPAGLTCDL